MQVQFRERQHCHNAQHVQITALTSAPRVLEKRGRKALVLPPRGFTFKGGRDPDTFPADHNTGPSVATYTKSMEMGEIWGRAEPQRLVGVKKTGQAVT